MKQTRLKPLSQPIWQPPPLHPVSYHLNLLPTVGYLRFLYVSSSVKTPLSFSDNQAETCLIITSNDTSLEYLPLIINISDTCKNQLKRLDFDNAFNLSSLWSIVILTSPCSRSWTLSRHSIPGLCLLSTHKRRTIIPRTLDAKTGLLTHLFTGIQVWKWPVYRLQTCYGRQSLKLCLIDSDFLFSGLFVRFLMSGAWDWALSEVRSPVIMGMWSWSDDLLQWIKPELRENMSNVVSVW